MIFNPDEEVQARIRLVFKKFREIRSASGVMRYFRAAHLPLPARPRVGPAPYEVVWQPARTSAILDMLHNPAYAGAYVYGRKLLDPGRRTTIVETVAQALKFPYVAITLQQGEEFFTAASYGLVRGELVRLPIVYQTEQVGGLVLAPRAPGEHFSPADHTLLEDVARQAGIAAQAVRLTADLKRLTVDLQHERERLVTAREEERRRRRRDLHDGLGPQLASLTLKLETARNRLAHDPLADTLLSDLAGCTQSAGADIRRLVYALRPPALDELGLLAALRELTLQCSDQVSMHLDAPACLPELPAAVEVAIYRIAQEALTNVVRHAVARSCDIQLALDEPAGWLSLLTSPNACWAFSLQPSRMCRRGSFQNSVSGRPNCSC